MRNLILGFKGYKGFSMGVLGRNFFIRVYRYLSLRKIHYTVDTGLTLLTHGKMPFHF